jgi:HEPN domain-containing protein
MNNETSAKALLSDAVIILDETQISLERGHWHRVVRKCQEATELAIKGLFRYLGIEYFKSHLLGRVIKRELGRFGFLTRDELNKMAFIADSLAFDREPSFYGSPDGTPASELFKGEDAREVIEEVKWVINAVRKVME